MGENLGIFDFCLNFFGHTNREARNWQFLPPSVTEGSAKTRPLILPTFRLGARDLRNRWQHFNWFLLWVARSSAMRRLRFHERHSGKPLKWFPLYHSLIPDLKVGENEKLS